MKTYTISEYLITIRCTHYTKYNVPQPVKTGSFVFEITEDFWGDELQAASYYNIKYNKHCVSRYSITDFEVVDLHKKIQEGGSK